MLFLILSHCAIWSSAVLYTFTWHYPKRFMKLTAGYDPVTAFSTIAAILRFAVKIIPIFSVITSVVFVCRFLYLHILSEIGHYQSIQRVICSSERFHYSCPSANVTIFVSSQSFTPLACLFWRVDSF